MMSFVPRVADPNLPQDMSVLVQALGINRPALAVLVALSSGEAMHFSTIAERSQIPPGTLVKQLPHLESLGLVRANTPPPERRGRRDVLWSIDAPALDVALATLCNRLLPPTP